MDRHKPDRFPVRCVRRGAEVHFVGFQFPDVADEMIEPFVTCALIFRRFRDQHGEIGRALRAVGHGGRIGSVPGPVVQFP